jgi:hypothetical protein
MLSFKKTNARMNFSVSPALMKSEAKGGVAEQNKIMADSPPLPLVGGGHDGGVVEADVAQLVDVLNDEKLEQVHRWRAHRAQPHRLVKIKSLSKGTGGRTEVKVADVRMVCAALKFEATNLTSST